MVAVVTVGVKSLGLRPQLGANASANSGLE